MHKKVREREQLTSVYNEADFASVDESERPDFVLTMHDGTKFGVEITSLFHSESQARIANIPNYVGELITDRRYRHKDDIAALPVKEVEVRSPDGTSKGKYPVIISEKPTVAEFRARLAEAIAGKNVKQSSYAADLSHINLIIANEGGWPKRVEAEALNLMLLSTDVAQSIRESPFREIYFITQVTDRGEIYVPMKMLLLVESLYLFNGFFRTKYAGRGFSVDLEMHAFALTLCRQGASVFEADSLFGREGKHVIFGNTAAAVHERQPELLDLADMPRPSNAVQLECAAPDSIVDDKFVDKFVAFCDEYGFTGAIAFPTRRAKAASTNA